MTVCQFDETGDLVTDHMSHAAHHEAGVHHRNGQRVSPDQAISADDRFMHAGRLFRLVQLFLIADEVILIGAFHQRITLGKRPFIDQLTDALPGTDL